MSHVLKRFNLAVAIVAGALVAGGPDEARAAQCLSGPTAAQKAATPRCVHWQCIRRAPCQLTPTKFSRKPLCVRFMCDTIATGPKIPRPDQEKPGLPK